MEACGHIVFRLRWPVVIFMASSMINLVHFRFLAGFTIFTAFLFDFVVTLALLVLISRDLSSRISPDLKIQ